MSALAFAKKLFGLVDKNAYIAPVKHQAGFEQAVEFMERYPLPLLVSGGAGQSLLEHHRYPFMCIEQEDDYAVFEAHISSHSQIFEDAKQGKIMQLLYQSPVAAYDAFSDGRHGTSFHMAVEVVTQFELSDQKPVLNHLKEFQAYIRDQGYDVNLMQTTPDDFLKNPNMGLAVIRFKVTPENYQSFVKLGRNLYQPNAQNPWAMRLETIERMSQSKRADVRQVGELMLWDLENYSAKN